MQHYRRSRKDYPQGVIGIYDNNGKTIDRYTVVFEPWTHEDGHTHWPILGMSESPRYGFSQHDTLKFRYTRQAGERTINFANLPQDCQRAVLKDLES
jgi:hypothetical protein